MIESEQGGFLVETAAGCAGSWAFNVKYRFAGNVFEPAQSAAPVLLLERSFIPTAVTEGLCARCSDTFVAYLEKL